MRCTWFLLVCLLPAILAEGQNATTVAPVTTAPTKHPVVKTLDSALCKKCKCDKYNKVLDCSKLKLTEWFKTDEWDTLIYGTIKFTTIDLSNNMFVDIPQFPTLEVKNLILKHNNISTIAAAAFHNLTHITKLDLSYNNLVDKNFHEEIFKGPYSPSEYQPLEFLKELNLAHNHLHRLKEDIFEHVEHLESISLSENPFKMLDSETVHALGNLVKLKFLDLSHMQLTKLPEDLLHKFGSLETVVLVGNLFKEVPVRALETSNSIKSLNLDENPIEMIGGDKIFPIMPHLEYLSISYMPALKTVGPGAFRNLHKLNTLQASHNPDLTVFNEDAFANIDKKNTSNVSYPPIQKLYLDRNGLSDLKEKVLHNQWENVTDINLNGNPWDCDDHNVWLIQTYIKYVHDYLSPKYVNNVTCANPSEYKDKTLYSVHITIFQEEGSSSGGGGHMVLGIFIGIIVGIPMTFGILLILRRYRTGRTSSINYDRAKFDNNFDI